MEDSPDDTDPNINPQVIKNFHLDSRNKNFDRIIDHALTNTKAYEPFFNKFDYFALLFNFLTPKERDIHCMHEVMLKKKLTHIYTY